MKKLFLLLLFATACEPTLDWKWTPIDQLKRPTPADYPKSPAVVLEREDRFLNLALMQGRYYVYYDEIQRHDVIQILTEAGLKHAQVRIQFDDGGELVLLKARTISPSGEIKEVEPKRVIADTSQSGSVVDRKTERVQLFRFPDVKIGSVLEYVYTVRSPRQQIIWAWTGRLASDIPIRHYQMEFRLSAPMHYAFKLHNGETKFATRKDSDFNVVSLDLHNVPQYPEELWSPHWQVSEPWWAFRLTGIEPAQIMYDTWAHAQKQTIDDLYFNKKNFEGISPSLVGANCKTTDKLCSVDQTLAFVRDRTELSGFNEHPAWRPLKQVLSSAHANNYEKAILLAHLLPKTLNAQLGLLIRSHQRSFDHGFPMPREYNHLIVYVPKQTGIDAPLFLDPSCESCKVGELPPWSEGREALVVSGTLAFNGEIDAKADFITLEGTPMRPAQYRATQQVDLDDDGNIKDSVKIEREGEVAVSEQIDTRGWTAQKWKEADESFIRNRIRNARLKNSPRPRCEKKRSECTLELGFEATSFAAVEGDKMIVPLSLLNGGLEDRFRDEPRSTDLSFGNSIVEDEVIHLNLPAGYQVESVPPTMAKKLLLVEFVFETVVGPHEITLKRRYQTHFGRMPASAYQELREFFVAFYQSRHENIVLKKSP